MDAEGFQRLAESARTYRRYSGEAVPREELIALVEAARFAPTGNNSQLLRFLVVGGEDRAALDAVFAHLHWAALLKDWDGPAPDERPGGYIAVCLPASAAKNPVRLIDVGIAAQTLSLAAAARGLGCCMHKSYDACLSDELGVAKKGYEIALLLALGPRGERVEAIDAAAGDSLAYRRDADGVHRVPKLAVSGLLL